MNINTLLSGLILLALLSSCHTGKELAQLSDYRYYKLFSEEYRHATPLNRFQFTSAGQAYVGKDLMTDDFLDITLQCTSTRDTFITIEQNIIIPIDSTGKPIERKNVNTVKLKIEPIPGLKFIPLFTQGYGVSSSKVNYNTRYGKAIYFVENKTGHPTEIRKDYFENIPVYSQVDTWLNEKH